MAKIGFKDFLTVDTRPGESDQAKYREMRRKKTDTSGGPAAESVKEENIATCGCGPDCDHCGGEHSMSEVGNKCECCGNEIQSTEIDEALSLMGRRKKAIAMRRNKAKIAMGRRRAAMRLPDPERIKKRARRAARKQILKKLLKGVPKDELSNARKKEIETRLEKPGFAQRIDRIAKKMIPKIRKDALARRRGVSNKSNENSEQK